MSFLCIPKSADGSFSFIIERISGESIEVLYPINQFNLSKFTNLNPGFSCMDEVRSGAESLFYKAAFSRIFQPGLRIILDRIRL